jgi:hypothetical protein
MRSQPSLLLRLSPLCLVLVAACSSPRSSGVNPVETDAAADASADLGADVGDAVDAPADEAADASRPADAPEVADTPDVADVPADLPADMGLDATADVPVDAPADVAADVLPPLTCRSDRECGVRSQVCERTRGVCVDCLTTIDCTGTDVCSANRCVAAPPPCRSDRECSSRVQVCNTARMACVDCNVDRDCPAGNFCDREGNCAALTCTPNSSTCADETTRRVCSADGRTLTNTPCPTVANSASRCADGACSSSCNASFGDCDGSAANGCEVDLRASVANCGRCGNACPAQGGVAGCATGACTLACLTGRGDCDANLANGCETNLASSNAHCGRCGSPCGAGQTCTDGACVFSFCTSGQTLCAGACVDLNTNVAQCGACGRRCALANAVAGCSAGTCVVAACAPGFADCNGNPADGCEVNLTSSTANCGGCGRACALTNATATCSAGACAIAACDATFGDCNGNPADGCEVNGYTNAANCGACGRACAAGQSCQTGVCTTSACGTGLTACPGGSCRNLANDVANCGACARACPMGQLCTASVCTGAALRFSLTWNVTADLDIAVATPSGVVVNYAMLTGGGGVFETDSMATGPEQIYWPATPPSGTYSVCVIPYNVTASTSYTLQVFRGTALSATRTGTYTASAAAGAACSPTSPYRVLDFVY